MINDSFKHEYYYKYDNSFTLCGRLTSLVVLLLSALFALPMLLPTSRPIELVLHTDMKYPKSAINKHKM